MNNFLKFIIFSIILYFTGIVHYFLYETYILSRWLKYIIIPLYLIDLEVILRSFEIPVSPQLQNLIDYINNVKSKINEFKFIYNVSLPGLCIGVYLLSRLIYNTRLPLYILLVVVLSLLACINGSGRYLKFIYFKSLVVLKFIDHSIFHTFNDWNKKIELVHRDQLEQSTSSTSQQSIYTTMCNFIRGNGIIKILTLLAIITIDLIWIRGTRGYFMIFVIALLDNSGVRLWCILRILLANRFQFIGPLSVVLLLNGKYSVIYSLVFYYLLDVSCKWPLLFMLTMGVIQLILSNSPNNQVTSLPQDQDIGHNGLVPSNYQDKENVYDINGYFIMDPIKPKKMILTNDNVYIELPSDENCTFNIEYDFDGSGLSIKTNGKYSFLVSTDAIQNIPNEFKSIRFVFTQDDQNISKRLLILENEPVNTANTPTLTKFNNITISHENLEQFVKMIRSSFLRDNKYNEENDNLSFEIFLEIVFQCFGLPTMTHLLYKAKPIEIIKSNSKIENLFLTSDILTTLQLCWDEISFQSPIILSLTDIPKKFGQILSPLSLTLSQSLYTTKNIILKRN